MNEAYDMFRAWDCKCYLTGSICMYSSMSVSGILCRRVRTPAGDCRTCVIPLLCPERSKEIIEKRKEVNQW